MISKSKKINVMLEFICQHLNIRNKKFQYFTAKDERLLVILTTAYMKKERLSVKDLMSKSELGSPSKIHEQIKFLKSKNLIKYKATDDARRYQLVPSEKLLRYFDDLGNAIKQIISE